MGRRSLKSLTRIYQSNRHGNKEKDWQIVSLSFKTMIELKDQNRGVDLAYRVITVNKAGEGLPSNVVTAVL